MVSNPNEVLEKEDDVDARRQARMCNACCGRTKVSEAEEDKWMGRRHIGSVGA